MSNDQTLTKAAQPKSIDHIDSEDVNVEGRSSLDMLEGSEDVILEQVEQNPYDVSYTCLILPRLITSNLSGELADCVQTVIKQISVSFGWELDFLSVQSDYLQWTFRVPLSTSTTHVIQVVRNQTSRQIFIDFPDLEPKNETEDFWASGYLLFWGSQPHPIEVVQRYIRQTRKQQGIYMDE